MGCLIVAGCNEPTVRDIIEDSRLDKYSQSIQTQDHILQVRFVPESARLVGQSGLSGDARVGKATLDSLRSKSGFRNGILFLLRLSPASSAPTTGFENDVIYGKISGYGNMHQAMSAFTFGLGSKIWLEAGDKQIPMANCQMENSFGISPSRTFILLFPPLPESFDRRAKLSLILDDIVPGLARRKMDWTGMAVENAE